MANVVMVKKNNVKWRSCVDYIDLNKACPKDAYPLLSIDQLIDATAKHLLLTFMDAFSGYHQIKMAEVDIPKNAFITHRAMYTVKVISFGLVNAGATYQRMMNTIFKDQIRRIIEVYVDDMILKSITPTDHIQDLIECF